MLEQFGVTSTDIIGFIVIVAVLAAFLVWFDKTTDAGSNIKKKFVDKRFDRLLAASNEADERLRKELLTFLEDAQEEHEQFKKWFDNDKRAIERHDKELQELRERQKNAEKALTVRLEETTLLMKSVRALMAVQVFGDDSSIVKKAMDEMDEYLIEERVNHEQ